MIIMIIMLIMMIIIIIITMIRIIIMRMMMIMIMIILLVGPEASRYALRRLELAGNRLGARATARLTYTHIIISA